MCTAESSQVSLSAIAQELKTLTDEERAALRASRFHSAPAPPSTRRSRFAHPGGALATNKAAALAKFLKRKLEEDGAATLDPALVERAVENAKVTRASVVTVGKMRHVDSFSDTDEAEDEKFKCKTLNEGGSTGQVRSKKNVKGKKVNKSHNVDHLRRLKVKAGKKRKKRK